MNHWSILCGRWAGFHYVDATYGADAAYQAETLLELPNRVQKNVIYFLHKALHYM